jgi:phage terminase large subunit-like protein
MSPAPKGDFIDLGSVVADWIEQNLVHGEGDYYGKPWKLEWWQRWFVRRIYLCNAETRARIVRRALLVLPEGNGKTELVAAIMLAELAGPTIVNENFEPSLRPAPNIPIAAASYDQSDRLFGAAQTMAEHEDSAIRPFLEIGEREIRRKGEPGKMFRITAVAGTNTGGLPTAFGADEIQEWIGPKERVHLIITNSLAKREGGLELNITTPDDADPESLLGRLSAYGKKVVSGEIKDDSFLFMWFAATTDWDLDDPKQLRKAIEEATPASWINVERVAARLEVDHIPLHEFERYKLARFVRPAKFWLPNGKWELIEDKKRGVPPDGTEIVVGFDGSYARDATGLVGCTMDGHLFVIAAWERPGKAPSGWNIPRVEVDAAVNETMKRWKVRELVCDPHRWTQEIQDWEQEYGETVIHFPTGTSSRMSPACARFYAGVVSGEGMTHDGDPMLQQHLYNAITKETRDGAFITKEHRASPRKIDLAVAAVMAYERAMVIAGDKPHKSAYEDESGQYTGLTTA